MVTKHLSKTRLDLAIGQPDNHAAYNNHSETTMRLPIILLSGLLLSYLPQTVYACRINLPSYRYLLDKQNRLAYAVEGIYTNDTKIIQRLPQANTKQFHRVNWPPTMTQYDTEWDEGYSQHFYFSDNQRIYWIGQAISNPPGTPPVDAASFQARNEFAADRDSIYFNGVRTDDNHGEKQVDFDTLRGIASQHGSYPGSPSISYLHRDQRNLYLYGRYIGSANSYRIVAKKQPAYDQMLMTSCDSPPSEQTIALTDHLVLLDGRPLSYEFNGKTVNADPDSFRLIDWLPGQSLQYSDQRGRHEYSYRQ